MNYGSGGPAAIVVAQVSELQRNQNILYNLVRPTKDDPSCIESNLKLTNVLPKKRIYRMSNIEELEIFKKELLERPLVLQSTIEGGPGVSCFNYFPDLDCKFVRFSENYIVLLNQIHPKVRSRLEMGLEVAIKYLRRSESFILTFTFNDVIEKMYRAIMKEYNIILHPRDRITCTDAELTIRYRGNKVGLKIANNIMVHELSFAFEDINALDLKVDTMDCAMARQRRSLPIDQGELVSILKGWKFGDFDVTDGLLNAYAEISGASVPPPSYEKVVLHAVQATQIENSYNNRESSMDYGYCGSSTAASSCIGASHYENNRDIAPVLSDRDAEPQSRKTIKPTGYFDTSYKTFPSAPPKPDIPEYHNAAYKYSPENHHEGATILNTDVVQYRPVPHNIGERNDYGYEAPYIQTISTVTVPAQPNEDVHESFI